MAQILCFACTVAVGRGRAGGRADGRAGGRLCARDTHVDEASKQPTPAGWEHTRPAVAEEALRVQQATEAEAEGAVGQPALVEGPTSTIGSAGAMQAVSSSHERAGLAARSSVSSPSSG